MNQKVKIILAGASCVEKTLFRRLIGQKGVLEGSLRKQDTELLLGGLQLTEDITRAGDQDYIILFPGEDVEMLDELQTVIAKNPRGILVLSDYRVYGTCFGENAPRKEQELGYASHIQEEDSFVWEMRMTEHLVYRLAKEENIPIRIARMDLSEPDLVSETVQEALYVLFYGTAGEVYNLHSFKDFAKKQNSPLSPIVVRPDTGKLEGLHAAT